MKESPFNTKQNLTQTVAHKPPIPKGETKQKALNSTSIQKPPEQKIEVTHPIKQVDYSN